MILKFRGIYNNYFFIFKVSMQRIRSANVPSRRRRRSKKKNKEFDENKEKDKNLIDCLYVGLMCCECVIS